LTEEIYGIPSAAIQILNKIFFSCFSPIKQLPRPSTNLGSGRVGLLAVSCDVMHGAATG
jgi:hypothetical protein